MTLDDYIKNPMGKKNSVLSMKEIYLRTYESKFKQLMLRENGLWNTISYKGANGSYYIHIKVPSEVIEDFYYDLVFKFSPPNDVLPDTLRSLDKYDFQVFSNDPAFAFGFAHAFKTHGLFLTELSSKMSKVAIKDKGKEKNPNDEVGYVKSIVFAYFYMKQKNLFSKIIHIGDPTMKIKAFLSTIEEVDIKISKRQEEGVALAKSKRKTAVRKERESSKSGRVVMTKTVNNVSHVKHTTHTANTRKTKKSKRI